VLSRWRVMLRSSPGDRPHRAPSTLT
jgi:hypothetical protein